MGKDIRIEKSKILYMLDSLFEKQITELEPAGRGNIKSVYFFNHDHKEYVLALSKTKSNNRYSRYLTELLIKNNIETKKVIKSGYYNDFYYTICNKILGETLNGLTEKKLNILLPAIAENLKRIHFIDVSHCKGFGWIDENGDGEYSSWQAFLEGFFSEKQNGYWKNWYELFENSFLDRNIFHDLYKTMISLSKHCEGKRYLVHGDFHMGDIIIKDSQITGIIDWDNVMYGDFIFDIASLQMNLPKFKIVDRFKEYYKIKNIEVPTFDERFKCLTLCRGLDSLRFFSKHGQKESHDSVLSYLKELISS